VDDPTPADDLVYVDENFVIELTDSAASEERWFLVMRFGLPFLLKNQPLLMEVLARRATIVFRDRGPHYKLSDALRYLSEALKLRFEVRE
jgi:hypothetical protein